MLIGDLLAKRARNCPDDTFLDTESRSISYKELYQHAQGLAGWIIEQRITEAAICAENAYGYFVVHFGCALAKVPLAHLPAGATLPEMLGMLKQTSAQCLWTDREPSKLSQHFIKNALNIKVYSLEQLEISNTTAIVNAPDNSAPILQTLFTSGSTGQPKGVLISHEARFRHALTHLINLKLTSADSILCALPLYHQFGQWLFMGTAIMGGSKLFMPQQRSTETYLESIKNGCITVLPAVPTLLHRLLEAAPRNFSTKHLRLIVYGGAPISAKDIPRIREVFNGVELFQGYGQTETGFCIGLDNRGHDECPSALGKPDLFSEIKILDDGQEVKPGQIGEIYAKTPYLCAGYTDGTMLAPDQWWPTQDLAWQDEHGYYHYAGRCSDIIISGGVNIAPLEVENALIQHPKIKECAVVGLPDAEWGQILVAAIITAKDFNASFNAESIRDWLRRFIAVQKLPRRIFRIDKFPRTAIGKLQRHKLAELLEK